jgi:rfaE bifunctional protein nucleotidyltransferase chain/domain
MMEIDSKIIDIQKALLLISELKNNNKKIVFTNGCFDILHKGHIEFLSKASSLGDYLIVGLNSDSSVKKLKGPNRPINDQTSRSIVLASIFFIDNVIIFDEDNPYNIIKSIHPDILVKGKDYKDEEIIGYDIVKEYGGDIKTIELINGYSTSNIIDRIESNIIYNNKIMHGRIREN